MKKYLLTKIQILLLFFTAIAYCIFQLLTTDNLSLNAEQFFRPYAQIFFVAFIVLMLAAMKRENWKKKVRILTLIVVLTFMLFNTSLQLHNLFDSGREYLNIELAKNTTGDLNFDNIEKMSKWVSNGIFFEIFYRIGKIILLDIFAIFAFFAINKSTKEMDE